MTDPTEKVVQAAGDRWLVVKDPEREGDYWRIRGRRWIKSRQIWATHALSYRCEAFEWERQS